MKLDIILALLPYGVELRKEPRRWIISYVCGHDEYISFTGKSVEAASLKLFKWLDKKQT